MRVGNGAPPPAPSDPSVGYPPGYMGMGMFSAGIGPSPPIPGFAYPLHATRRPSTEAPEPTAVGRRSSLYYS